MDLEKIASEISLQDINTLTELVKERDTQTKQKMVDKIDERLKKLDKIPDTTVEIPIILKITFKDDSQNYENMKYSISHNWDIETNFNTKVDITMQNGVRNWKTRLLQKQAQDIFNYACNDVLGFCPEFKKLFNKKVEEAIEIQKQVRNNSLNKLLK